MNTVDFSDKAVYTGPLPCFSPDGTHVALAQDYRLVVREVESMAVVGLFTCLDRVDALAWSPCGELLLATMFGRGTAQVFSLSDPGWSASITEGLAGICAARWCPNGRQVLLISDFGIKTTVWSLTDQESRHLSAPKHPNAGLAFSPDGATLAVLERADCKDILTFYSAESWAPLSRTPLPTADAVDLSWCPDCSCVAVWDSPAQGPLACVVDTAGSVLATQSTAGPQGYGLGYKSLAWSPSGQLLALGGYDTDVAVLNNVTWSALATFQHAPAVAGPATAVVYQEELELPRRLRQAQERDQAEREARAASPARSPSPRRAPAGAPARGIPRPGSKPPSPRKRPTVPSLAIPPPSPTSCSSRGGSPRKAGPPSARSVASDASPRKSSAPGEPTRLHSPRKAPLDQRTARPPPVTLVGALDNPGTLAGAAPDGVASRFSVAELPVRLPVVKAPADRPNPKAGVGLTAWSPDGAYLVTRCDDRPNVLWLWDSARLELAAAVVGLGPVRGAAWAPMGDAGAVPRLAVVCGAGRVYFWSPQGASSVAIPCEGLKAVAVAWAATGRALLLGGRDAAVVAYVAPALAGLAA